MSKQRFKEIEDKINELDQELKDPLLTSRKTEFLYTRIEALQTEKNLLLQKELEEIKAITETRNRLGRNEGIEVNKELSETVDTRRESLKHRTSISTTPIKYTSKLNPSVPVIVLSDSDEDERVKMELDQQSIELDTTKLKVKHVSLPNNISHCYEIKKEHDKRHFGGIPKSIPRSESRLSTKTTPALATNQSSATPTKTSIKTKSELEVITLSDDDEEVPPKRVKLDTHKLLNTLARVKSTLIQQKTQHIDQSNLDIHQQTLSTNSDSTASCSDDDTIPCKSTLPQFTVNHTKSKSRVLNISKRLSERTLLQKKKSSGRRQSSDTIQNPISVAARKSGESRGVSDKLGTEPCTEKSTVSAMKKVGVRERKVLTKHQIKELFDSGDELDDDCFDYMETESDDSDDEDYTGSISKPSESKRRLREAHKIRLDRRSSASKNSNTHKVNKCSPSTSSKTPTSSITTKSNGPSQSTTPAPVPSSFSTQKVYNRSEKVDQNKSVITRSERNSIVPARTVHNDISKFFDEELINIGNFLSQFKDGNFNTTACLPNDLEDLEIPFYNQDILIFYPNAPNYTPVDDESVDFNYWHYFAYAIPFYPNLAERVELRPTMLEVTFGVPDYHTDCFDQYTICKYRSVTHRFDAETNLKTVLLNYMKAHPKQFYEPVPFTEFYDLDSNNCYVNPFDAIHNLSYNGVGFTYTEDGVKIEYFLNHNLSPEPVDMSPLKVFVRCPGKADNCPDYLIVDVYFDVNCFDTFDLNIIGSRYKSILDSQESALETSSINDTIEFVETIPKDGFKLALYNYQKRSLTWMLMAEHKAFSPDVTYMETSMLARFSASNQVVDLRTNKVLKHIPENLQDSAYRCIGGILADAPGNGKTVTMISLIHSNPLIKFNDLEMTDVEKTMCIPSKATLVICASNLVEQWKAEIATCLGPNVNCMSISTAKEFYESSWYDYMYSDIIIMPIVFLASSTYENMVSEEYKLLVKGEKLDPELYFSRKTVPMIENGYSSFWHQKGKVSLEAIFFHRIVYDEFHELNKSPASMKKLAFNMRARCIWGMTGTPNFSTINDITLSADFLHCRNFDKDNVYALSFKHKFVKRNNMDLRLPPCTDKTIWVHLTEAEMMFYKTRSRYSTQEAFMLCSYFQIDRTLGNDDQKDSSVAQVAKKLLAALKAERNKLKIEQEKGPEEVKQLILRVRTLESRPRSETYEIYMSQVDMLHTARKNLARAQTSLASIGGRLEAKQSEYNDLKKSLRNIGTPKATLCFDCIKSSLNTCNHLKHGSKVLAMRIALERLLAENPTAKIIMFIQFKKLAQLIQDSLKETHIPFVRVTGKASDRQNAIFAYKNDRNIRIIVLSTEDSISGLNLPETTHIFLVHPLWYGDDPAQKEKAKAAENQAIARAYRLGLDHPLEVIRFVTKNTMEERIEDERRAALHAIANE